jgi:hypothetical protein
MCENMVGSRSGARVVAMCPAPDESLLHSLVVEAHEPMVHVQSHVFELCVVDRWCFTEIHVLLILGGSRRVCTRGRVAGAAVVWLRQLIISH